MTASHSSRADAVRGDFGLVSSALEAIRDLCAATPGIIRVWVFGSRARDDWRPRSDLDLAVEAPGWSSLDLLSFREAIKQLPIVYRVDAVLMHAASPELAREIARDRKLLWPPQRARS